MKKLLLLCVAASCGGTASQGPCSPRAGGSEPYATLGEWCMVSLKGGDVVAHEGVTPYELNTPLFSDGAVKRRTVWLPAGTQAQYSADGVFDFPDGTVFTKSFGFRDDLRKAQPAVKWVETRVVWKNAGVWRALSYTWDDAQAEARAAYAGEVKAIQWIDVQGQPAQTNYLVPNQQQCKQCHSERDVLVPIGPKARNLNRLDGQLQRWAAAGLVAGVPADPPRLPVWNDPSTGTPEQRARAYLEVNCAHCHNASGSAQNTGLFLLASETNPAHYGVCKLPSAAGPGSGGHQYDVVPRDPDASIMVFRLGSTDPGKMMPQIGRSIVDGFGLQLVRDWISGLPAGPCP